MLRIERFGFVLLAASALCGCGAEETPVPEFKSDASGVVNPRSCKEARTGEPMGLFVAIDGEVASCVGEDVQCSLADIEAFDESCQIGKPGAICKSDQWRIECVDLDASMDAASDAASDG